MADAFDTNIRHQISFIKTIPGFRDLSLESQKELVKGKNPTKTRTKRTKDLDFGIINCGSFGQD